MPPTRRSNQTSRRSSPLPSLKTLVFEAIKKAIWRPDTTEHLNFYTEDLGHFINYRYIMTQQLKDTAERMTLWHDYEIGHRLRNETQEDDREGLVTELLTTSRLVKRALRAHQIFRHVPWAIAHLQGVTIGTLFRLSIEETNWVEAEVANYIGSNRIAVESQQTEPTLPGFHTTPLRDNHQGHLMSLMEIFEGPPITMEVPAGATPRTHHPVSLNSHHVIWEPNEPNQEEAIQEVPIFEEEVQELQYPTPEAAPSDTETSEPSEEEEEEQQRVYQSSVRIQAVQGLENVVEDDWPLFYPLTSWPALPPFEERNDEVTPADDVWHQL
jgi:hypothetical protein